mmetsp:Transcript_25673/g.68560  ORF Transcript_25673/g.68560 Transcript_25673/m.68560 type:complete len:201 (-) Transcript_25673:402-1004(-)
MSRMSPRPASGPSLLTTASTMQPSVMLVGSMPADLISFQVDHTPSRSWMKPCARMRLPNVCAPRTLPPPSPPRLFFSCVATRSARPARMHASQTEPRSTSSRDSSIASSMAIVLSRSATLEERWTFFSKVERVTWLGFTPQARISSTRPHTSSRPALTAASISSLNVTALGTSPPDRIARIADRARGRSPLLRYALIMML